MLIDNLNNNIMLLGVLILTVWFFLGQLVYFFQEPKHMKEMIIKVPVYSGLIISCFLSTIILVKLVNSLLS